MVDRSVIDTRPLDILALRKLRESCTGHRVACGIPLRVICSWCDADYPRTPAARPVEDPVVLEARKQKRTRKNTVSAYSRSAYNMAVAQGLTRAEAVEMVRTHRAIDHV